MTTPAKTVLIVDDEAPVRQILKRMLASVDYRVEAVANGKEAQEFLRTSVPDMVLLDITMPEMDGMSLCRWIRNNEKTRLVPVVMITARGDIPDHISGLSQGADEYIAKPFDLNEVLARVAALFRRCAPPMTVKQG